MNNLFEGDPPKTDFEFMRRILNVTPENFTWSASKLETVRNGTLLALKTTTTPVEGASGIFFVKTPEFQGFQYGVPEAKETGVSVDLYGKRALLRFTFRERGGAAAITPQADIRPDRAVCAKRAERARSRQGVSAGRWVNIHRERRERHEFHREPSVRLRFSHSSQ